MRRVLVTGGAGFIGSHVVDALVRAGDEVVVLDDLSTGRRENLEGSGAELVVGDLRDEALLTRLTRGVRHVLHLGAVPSVARSVRDPLTSHDVNATGTLRLLEASRRAGVLRFVQASSSSVYGDQVGERKHEAMVPRPLSPYAVSKLAAEHYARVYWQLFGLETVSLRFFNVFGPRQSARSEYAAVVPRFLDRVSRGEPPIVFGDGEQARDFTFVANVVDACLLALARPDVGGRVLNVAAGRAVSVNQLVAEVGKLAGKAIEAVHEAPRPGEIRHSLADVREAQEALGFVPGISFEEGLRLTHEAFGRPPR